ncbi:MAG: hypothetical protein H8E55_52070 [Pelagibacterales bacterium]|nr:hypothetical protein [Pelagibacterales bacterium]
MAKNIAIWPGSSSFTAGATPFGLYDTDNDFTSSADNTADWSAKRLGYPLNEIELQDVNFYTCFEEAVSEYGAQVNTYNIRDNMLNLYGSTTSSNNLSGQKISANFGGLIELADEYGSETGTGGNVTYYTGSIAMTSSKQIYDIASGDGISFESGTPGTDKIEIKRLYHDPTPAMVKYFDPFVGTGLGSQQMMETFGWGNYSPGVSFMMMPIYGDILRLQAIEFNDQIRKSAYSFEIVNDRIKFFPIPNGANFTKVWFEYILKSDRSNPLKGATGTVSDFSNVPYQNIVYSNVNAVGKQWIRRYALALAKEMLGYIRGKYSALPIPNAEITLNSADLISAAQTEKEGLITELKEILDSMSRQMQLERKAAEATSLQEQFNKIPTKIYIG